MIITSPAFKHQEKIPAKYTCDGPEQSPPLEFADVPEETKSLALVMDDPDAPRGVFLHWLLWNIPPDIRKLGENEKTPTSAVVGKNSFREKKYGGPCPPSGIHHYYFKLYALNSELSLDPDTTTRQALEQEISRFKIAEASLMGIYGRN